MPYLYDPTGKDHTDKTYSIIDIELGYSLYRANLMVYDEFAVNSMIYNVLFTVPGERPFNPEFGSDIPFLLQKPITKKNAWLIESEIIDTLRVWVPIVSSSRRNFAILPHIDQGYYSTSFSYDLNTLRGLRTQFGRFDADLYAGVN